jgi:hypothetical protein
MANVALDATSDALCVTKASFDTTNDAFVTTIKRRRKDVRLSRAGGYVTTWRPGWIRVAKHVPTLAQTPPAFVVDSGEHGTAVEADLT